MQTEEERKEKRRNLVQDWRLRNKEKCKEYSKREREANKEKLAINRKTPEAREKMLKAVKRWRLENRERYLQTQRLYKAKNRFKINARFKVTNAIRRGKMIRGIVCEDCGCDNQKMEAHHEDYNKPLEVIWVCRTCHCKRHKKLL